MCALLRNECAACPGITVRLTPELLCGLRRILHSLPGIDYIEAIPTCWKILDDLVIDWEIAASKYTFSQIQNVNEKMTYALYAMDELKPKYILCLFSYINFFFLLENGYKYIFHELLKLSFQLKLNLKIPKSPKRNKYIMKMRLVRNHTVIHWGGLDNKDKLKF